MTTNDILKQTTFAPYPEQSHHFEREVSNALCIEFARLDNLLGHHLAKLRKRGRSILGDAIGGAVIEEGEAEGLLQSLYEAHTKYAQDEVLSPEEWISPLEPLERARTLYDLLPVERDLLLLGLSVEIDSRYARLVAFLNDHVSMTRPTLGLAMAILFPDGDPSSNNIYNRLVSNGPLSRYGLLQLEGDEPLANRALVVPENFWPRLLGMTATPPFKVHSLIKEQLTELCLSESTSQQAQNAQNWAAGQLAANVLLVVTGDAESGREALARAIISRICNHAIIAEHNNFEEAEIIAILEREALWYGAAVIVTEPEQIQDSTRLQLLKQLSVPIVFLNHKTEKFQLTQNTGRLILEVSISEPKLLESTELWRHLLKTNLNSQSIDAMALATRFPFGPGRIISAIQLANAQAESEGRLKTQLTDLEVSCQRLRETHFGELAQKLPCRYNPQDIVLSAETRQELNLITTWAKHGGRVFSAEGYGEKLRTGQGLACLFSGPSGTGKTMAAQVIAKQIDFDLYRIDLSQVVNKYIGETEKNLSKLFDEAQRSKVVLFFDEADALFGRRSEVKDAHDRYANIETGYLLQRLETYDGLAILATNLQNNLDDAFLRRLQVIAQFPIPQAAERKAIWQSLLPPENKREQDLDLSLLSERFDVAGGDIRNAIFTALLLAAEDNDSFIGMRHLVLGLWRELQKSGRIVDLVHFGEWRNEIEKSTTTLTQTNK